MKTFRYIIMGSFAASLLIGSGSCTKDSGNPSENGYNSLLDVSADGTTFLAEKGLSTLLSENLTFSDDELEILLHMKEEEKLAGDVYSSLYEKWGTNIFSNISNAEINHMNAVIYLLQDYGNEYTEVKDKGVFASPDFQELFDQLVAKGSESVEAALQTGALIEEMDIKDLDDHLEVVKNENIILVFENLQKGSRNHLRAFSSQLENIGITYTPVYISQEEYDQIVSTPMETGSGSCINNQNKKGKQYRGGR